MLSEEEHKISTSGFIFFSNSPQQQNLTVLHKQIIFLDLNNSDYSMKIIAKGTNKQLLHCFLALYRKF